MQTKNFKGQDCREKSFKNQDLTGADFSDCDLRGVDFSGKDLTAAKFCNTRMGRTKKASFALLLFRLLLSVIGAFIAVVCSVLINWCAEVDLKLFDLNTETNKAIFTATCSVLSATVLILASIRQRWYYAVCFFGLLIAISGYGGANEFASIDGVKYSESIFIAIVIVGVIVGTLLMIGVGAGVGVVIVIGAVVGFASVAVVGILAIALVISGAVSVDGSIAIAIAIAVTGLVHTVAGFYLGKRAIDKEEHQLLWLRELSLKLNCFFTSQFSFAVLKNINFSNTDLKYARFKSAKISNCNFKNTKSHHFALFENTPLEPRKVRDLVIDGIISDKNFATLDLRGLDFSNLNLEGFDFSHANLSGANLSHCQLTGAILEGWNIDSETNLEGVDCRYYYFEKIKENDSEEDKNKKRMPANGKEYSAGEFTTIFQHLAKTVNIIAHNPVELAAIKLSVEEVSKERENDGIKIQSLEVKNGQIVVGIIVPKTEDAGVLHHSIQETMQQILEKMNKLETGNTTVIEKQVINSDFVQIADNIYNQVKQDSQK